MTKAKDIELALYRSGLLRNGINTVHFEKACKNISRDTVRIDRHRLNACNGIMRFDVAAKRMMATWTEADQDKADIETSVSRETIKRTLRPFLKTGCKWEFYTDPRANVVLEITHRNNRSKVAF